MKKQKITLYLASAPLLVVYALTYPNGYSIDAFQEFCVMLQTELLEKTEYDKVHIEMSTESLQKTLNDNGDLFMPDKQGNVHLKESTRLNHVLSRLETSVLETIKQVSQMQHERMSSNF